MLNFCTLFDSFYLSRGLVMYESLKSQTSDFHLYIFAFDDLCYEILVKMKLEKVTAISLAKFENPTLLSIKPSRSKAEYCWTSTPSTIEYVFNNFIVDNCTYIDADLYFYNSPICLINELEDIKSVLITEHRYSKFAELFEQKRAGRFCVQFITFTNSSESQLVLNIWKNQCIDWCYARYEDGKFGDQKYLDEWPQKYSNVHILKHLGGGVAPWNVDQYIITNENQKLTGIEKKSKLKFDIIFFHFHFVRFVDNETVDIGWHYLPKGAVNYFYNPYIKRIIETEELLRNLNSNYKTILFTNKTEGPREFIKKILKQTTKYNLIKLKNL